MTLQMFSCLRRRGERPSVKLLPNTGKRGNKKEERLESHLPLCEGSSGKACVSAKIILKAG